MLRPDDPELADAKVALGAGDSLAHCDRAPLLQADAPFVVKTLPNGAKRIDVSTTFFDTLEQHIMENAGMRVRSAGNPNVFVSGDLTPKPHGLTGDENELLRAVVRPALERAADCPLSRVEYLISL